MYATEANFHFKTTSGTSTDKINSFFTATECGADDGRAHNLFVINIFIIGIGVQQCSSKWRSTRYMDAASK